MKFFAFAYHSGRNTTSGQPNEKTGYFNIAGNLAVFSKKLDRDKFVDESEYVSVSAREARGLRLGMSVSDYEEMVEMSIDMFCEDLTDFQMPAPNYN